jgi:hypothetical protein
MATPELDVEIGMSVDILTLLKDATGNIMSLT